ncbi:hypothetical protein SAMN05660748_3156 [Blastococcus aggregatus]|uniref:Uncharacterized protein n=1 Tax=Blastococcus aggregatus TaxID=38502 RepID=A0A285V9Y8_9ACTN|nr:hypothetical protein [Blastococcus aggregatus]SOC50408.1 hypothetical protein SAMN05660748_3156 [Blastococcus aggregatus]
MKIDFERDLITDRMNILGLSERAIVQKTKIPYFQFRQARKTGQFDGHVTLSQIHRLAFELGLTVAELLSPPSPAEPDQDGASEQEERTSPTADAQVLIPVLVSVPRLASIIHAARTLGWTRERIEDALASIPPVLEGTGLRLHKINGRATITPIDSAKSLLQVIGRLQTTTSGLNASQARTLLRITNGEPVFHRNIGNQEKLTLGALKNMGCIELDEQAQYRPTADIRLALPDID